MQFIGQKCTVGETKGFLKIWCSKIALICHLHISADIHARICKCFRKARQVIIGIRGNSCHKSDSGRTRTADVKKNLSNVTPGVLNGTEPFFFLIAYKLVDISSKAVFIPSVSLITNYRCEPTSKNRHSNLAQFQYSIMYDVLKQ